MTARSTCSGRLIVAALMATSLSACLSEASADGEEVQVLNVPEVKPGRAHLPPELAALMYPEGPVSRDPFLTAAEQRRVEGIADPAPTPTTESTDSDKPRVRRVVYVPKDPTLKQLHAEVNGIILGPRNTFFFRGRLYEEGDAIEKTDWVVKSITESGIMLRSKDGTGVDFLKFARGPSLLFDFNKK
jgi:hypothetical protein